MKTSIIRQRVADFLGRFPPFDSLKTSDLLELAGSGKVRFHESEEFIFRQGDAHGPLIWVIQQGCVELVVLRDDGEHIRDVVGEGDVLGVERFVGNSHCTYSARTTTDVMLYGIAAEAFEPLIARYPAVHAFLSARFLGAGGIAFGRSSWLDAEAPPLPFLRSRLSIVPRDATPAELRSAVSRSRNGAVAVVDDGGCPLAVTTAIDLLRAEDSGLSALETPPTASPALTTRDAIQLMLQSRRGELAITADGTPSSAVQAVLTASELATFCRFHPVSLYESIRRATSGEEILPLLHLSRQMVREALAAPRHTEDCSRLHLEEVCALAEACIRLSDEDLRESGIDASDAPFCWVMFGASARGDTLGNVLPTVAVVYDDCAHPATPQDRIYFAAVAGGTNDQLHALGLSDAGAYWPEGSQPSMPLSEWKRFYTETIRNPLGHNLYERRSFFDMRILFGNAAIIDELQRHVEEEFQQSTAAIALLATDTLVELPPLTFFQGLVLGMDGEQCDTFDIADAVIAPVANAARVFAMAKGNLREADTIGRLKQAAIDFPEGAAVMERAADGFRIGLYYQSLLGSTRILPGSLQRFDQILLKTAFSFVHNFLEFTVSTFVRAHAS